MNNDLKYWAAISQFNKIGPINFAKLTNFFSTIEAAWLASTQELITAGWKKQLAEDFIIERQSINPEQEIEKIKNENIEIITIKDPRYPQLLKESYSPPAVLFVKGKIDNLNYQKNLAVVGTRKTSAYGRQITLEIVKPLVRNKFIITSGLALGIDALAHQTALENQGRTIAVLGTGLDRQSIYPRTNFNLAQKILAQNGTLISEFPIGTQPLKHHFPLRNRIIAALSLGTVVIEAPPKSGALITAYQALEHNREVFAVPGSIFNHNSAGPNKLIQKGAKLITSYQDILEELNLQLPERIISENKKTQIQTREEKIILAQLNSEPVHVDQIIKNLDLEPAEILSTLSLMEIKGLIKNLGSQNYISLIN